MMMEGNLWLAAAKKWASATRGAALALTLALSGAIATGPAVAEPVSEQDVSAALSVFLSGATTQQGVVVATNPRIIDLYYNSPTELTVFFVGRNRQGRTVPGTLRAVYAASELWLWTSGSFGGSGMSGYGFRNPVHFGNAYVPNR